MPRRRTTSSLALQATLSGTTNTARQWSALAALLLVLFMSRTSAAQDVPLPSDSVVTEPVPGPDSAVFQRETRPGFLEDHTPRGALWRAAAVPSWGQLYNRQYLKLPFVYAGLAGIVWLAVRNNERYLLFRHAYQHKASLEGLYPEGEEPPASYVEDYARVLVVLGASSVSSSQLRPIRDRYRRNRDLSYFGIGLVYGLTVLDAYVSAHLLDFDVGEDLTVSVRPGPDGVAAALRVGL